MRTVPLKGLPQIEGLEILRCKVTARPDRSEATVEYIIQGEAEMIKLFKGHVRKVENYAGYRKYYPVDNRLEILISCRAGESIVTAALQYTEVLLLVVQAKITDKAKRKQVWLEKNPEQEPATPRRGNRRLEPVRQRHHQYN